MMSSDRSSLITGARPRPMQKRQVVSASSEWSMKKPYFGRCVWRTLAKVPSRLSPYQLSTRKNDASQRKWTLYCASQHDTA